MKRIPIPYTKREITQFWINKYGNLQNEKWYFDEEICWGCGCETYGNIDRCHLIAYVFCQNNNIDNLILLCRNCHIYQENFTKDLENANYIKSLILQGYPFKKMMLNNNIDKLNLMINNKQGKQILINKINKL
jgi:hypothetical protein